MRKLLLLFTLLIFVTACGPPVVELEIDVRMERSFLEGVDMFPVAIDIDLELARNPVPLTYRADIVCGPPPETEEVEVVTVDVEGIRCRSGVGVTAFVRPVDIEDFECEELSLNGRQSRRFVADQDILLGTAHVDDVFSQGRKACRDGSELATLSIE